MPRTTTIDGSINKDIYSHKHTVEHYNEDNSKQQGFNDCHRQFDDIRTRSRGI